MKLKNIAILGGAALALYLIFSKKDSSAASSGGLLGGISDAGSNLLGAIMPKEQAENQALANMAASFRNANITPALMQAKYNEFLTSGAGLAAALQNVPTNQYTRNTPTGTGAAIGTIGIIAPKYTPNATIAVNNGVVQTDNAGNIVYDSRAIINQGAGQQAYNAAIISGQSAVAAVEAKRQAEIAWVKSKG